MLSTPTDSLSTCQSATMGSPSPARRPLRSSPRRSSPSSLRQTTLAMNLLITESPNKKQKRQHENNEQNNCDKPATPTRRTSPRRHGPTPPPGHPRSTIGTVPFSYFLKMWNAVEQDDGWNTEDFEESSSFRRANTAIDPIDASTQSKAQYGRLLFKATDALFERVMDLQYYHQFLDIGHGVGNTVLQAAYTKGCEALGIELVGIRHERALVYQEKMAEVDKLHNQERDGKHYYVGTVRMRHGSLEAPEHRDFLTKHVDVAFCNNYGEVFGERCRKIKQLYTMDDYLAGNFCLMKPGAVFVTLYPLPLGFSCDEANAVRQLQGLEHCAEASFYAEEHFVFEGNGLLSWTNNSFKIYKYTRLQTNTFLCCNPDCENAREKIPILSYKIDDDKVVMNQCDCRVQRKTRRTKNYQVPCTKVHVD